MSLVLMRVSKVDYVPYVVVSSNDKMKRRTLIQQFTIVQQNDPVPEKLTI